MKKMFKGFLIIMFVVFCFACADHIETHDRVKAEVIEVHGDEVIIMDARGQRTAFFTEMENELKVHENIIVIYQNQTTFEDFSDDEIIDFKKVD